MVLDNAVIITLALLIESNEKAIIVHVSNPKCVSTLQQNTMALTFKPTWNITTRNQEPKLHVAPPKLLLRILRYN